MKPFIAAFSVILLSLAAGCVEKASEEPGLLYVCPDGSIVPEASECVTEKPGSSMEALPVKEEAEGKGVGLAYSAPSCVSFGCGNDTRYVGNRRTLKYHFCDCRYALNMSKGNRVCLKDLAEAESLNYSACRVCNPY